MAQSLSQIYLHLVFSTKNRALFLSDQAFRAKCHAYVAGTCGNLQCPALVSGGVADHVHIVCRLAKGLSVSVLIRELKRSSSQWVKEQDAGLSDFYWHNGYGAFSVSPGPIDALKQYIGEQEEHHRQESYQEELRRLLRKYGLTYDERNVWD
jgi:REP element-mobilizing transposase RayT